MLIASILVACGGRSTPPSVTVTIPVLAPPVAAPAPPPEPAGAAHAAPSLESAPALGGQGDACNRVRLDPTHFTPTSATAAPPSPSSGTPAIRKLRLGTLAPKQSPWAKVLAAWAKAVDMKTGGAVNVEWGWNGSRGPEPEMLSKVASGALDGAVLTSAALSNIYRPIAALQMPGAFPTWADLDRARAIARPDIDRAMKRQGFHLAFWADLGERRIFSRGFDVNAPGDLRGKAPDASRLDLTLLTLYRTAGICELPETGVTPAGSRNMPPNVAEALSGRLQAPEPTSALDFSIAPAAFVAARGTFDHASSMPAGFEIGALVFSEAALAALPPTHRQIMEQMSAAAEHAMSAVVRREDAAAFARISTQLAVSTPTPAQAKEWDHIFQDVCRSLKALLPGGVVSAIGYC